MYNQCIDRHVRTMSSDYNGGNESNNMELEQDITGMKTDKRIDNLENIVEIQKVQCKRYGQWQSYYAKDDVECDARLKLEKIYMIPKKATVRNIFIPGVKQQ